MTLDAVCHLVTRPELELMRAQKSAAVVSVSVTVNKKLRRTFWVLDISGSLLRASCTPGPSMVGGGSSWNP
jgi:hypothetical protein